MLGQLNWIGTQTRPDILFDVGDLTGCAKTATISEVLRLNKVVSRLAGQQVKLKYPRMEDINGCHLQVFSDASFGNLIDGGSQVGLLVFLVNSEGIRCPLYWQSRKARRVVKSTLAAETLALIEAAEAAVFISRVISDLLDCINLEIQCFVDNKSLVDALHSSHRVEDKRLRIDIAVMQDMLDRKEVTSVKWINTDDQLANCLTKRGASPLRLLEVLAC